MAYFNIRTPQEFDNEMKRYHAAMATKHMQAAYELLCIAAESEFKTETGTIQFVVDVTDTAAMSRRANWMKDYRSKLLRRTEKRRKTRAAMNAFLALYLSTVNDLYDWRNMPKGEK